MAPFQDVFRYGVVFFGIRDVFGAPHSKGRLRPTTVG